MPGLVSYEERVKDTLTALKIPAHILANYRLPLHQECHDLVSIGLDMFNRDQRMKPLAAAQWHAMAAAAKTDGIVLLVISAFRSLEYQRGIIERKLAQGLTLEQILSASALPAYSEHHTGRAIDIGTMESKPLTEAFEATPAFGWLIRRASDFGFSMTYPRGNSFGVIYEPWHWMCHE